MLTALGRYQIVERLGRGGVGEVYRATDPRLERTVALKVLREDALRDDAARRRFRLEARALSRLLHSNIATLFDFDSDHGVDFLVMEYVPGDTLAALVSAGALPEARARAIGLEVAEALQAAHEQGVIHRDLKPGNVIITPRGRAKVLDFGLAGFVHEGAAPSSATTREDLGRFGGTLPYVAPEQLQGERADARTDLYALGVMLFEMVTGVRPFSGDSPAALLYGILHEPAPALRSVSPGASPALEHVVSVCLEKVPSRRFTDVAAAIRALRDEGLPLSLARRDAVTGGAARPVRAIAVLPFENRSGDPAQEYFADGVTDALIADLAKIGALRVISRTSAMRFKGTGTPLPQVARELNVDALVEGSALQAGDRARVTVQLVDAATDLTLWADTFERDLRDVLTLQREVAQEIAGQISVYVTPDERARLSLRGPVNPLAHVAYLQGRYLWNRWTTDAIRESVERYEEAIRADPSYALAYAGLADSYGVLGTTNLLPSAEAYQRAKAAAEQGLAIDETVAELHASLGYVHFYYDWDWPRAERQFLRAAQLNPGYATGRRWYAQFLSAMGRHAEAIGEAERALELDPLSLIIHTTIGDVLFYARQYDRAISYYRRCIEMDPAFEPAHSDLARALEHVGLYDEAVREFQAATPLVGGPTPALATMLYRAGRREEAWATIEAALARTGPPTVSSWGLASFYAIAGDTERALDWLERAHAQRDAALVWIKVHPRIDGIRGEPRFVDLLARMRLDA
jgi:serine/threonine-protein kinase